MKTTLHAIAGDLEALEDILDDLLEVSEDDEATLDGWRESIEGNFSEKIQRIAHVATSLEDRAKARAKNAKSLAEIAAADEAKAKRLKAYALTQMQRAGITRVDTDAGRVSVCKNGGKLPLLVDDDKIPAIIPEEVQRITVALDKTRLRELLESGRHYDFARIADESERGSHLRIK
jgi:hypothetical protein